jgi:hypothetical protein
MLDITLASMVLAGLSVLVGFLVLGGGLAFGLFVQRTYPPDIPKEEEAPVVDRALLTRRSAAYRLGGMVLVGLAILTAIEYGFALALPSIVALLILGLFKAGLIMQYFMHVSTLWSEEGH